MEWMWIEYRKRYCYCIHDLTHINKLTLLVTKTSAKTLHSKFIDMYFNKIEGLGTIHRHTKKAYTTHSVVSYIIYSEYFLSQIE